MSNVGLGAMMAGGNPQEGRQKDDFYPTPPDVTEALMRRYFFGGGKRTGVCFEPFAGDGAMIDVLKKYFVPDNVHGSDINPQREDIIKADFKSLPIFGIDYIITNPPFNMAEYTIDKCLSLNTRFLALVLKSSFWHAKSRLSLFNDYPPSGIHPLTWRPDFLNKGRPTMEVMWCVWDYRFGQNGTTFYEPLSRPE